MFIVKFNISLSHNSEYTHTLFDGTEIVRVAQYFSEPATGARKNTSNEQNICSYYTLNHQIRGLLFHYKKIVILRQASIFLERVLKKHPDSLCENDNNNEVKLMFVHIISGCQTAWLLKKNRKIGNSGLRKQEKQETLH